MTSTSSRRVLVTGSLFLVLCASLFVLDRQHALDPIRSGLNEIVSPVSETFYRLVDDPGSPSDLEQELADVTAERDRLLSENASLKSKELELERLQEAMAVEQQNPDLNLTPVDVIGRDPTGHQMYLVINQGSADGIREGMAIVSPWWYVGQVTEVTENTATVMLIVDGSMKVGATLKETRGVGIVTGQWQEGGYLTMEYVEQNRMPAEGELVVTSDAADTQTRQVPPNILIGQVSAKPVVNPQTDQLEIQVRPGISNFNDLTVVFVAEIADDED